MPHQTRIEPALEVPELSDWIAKEIGHLFKRERKEKLKYVEYLLHAAYFRLRPHRDPIRQGAISDYSLQDQFFEASSFTSRELSKKLGDNYHDALRPFFDFPTGNEGYSRGFRMTKPYLLNGPTVDKLTDMWRNSQSARIVNRVNAKPLDCADLPANGLLRPLGTGVSVPALIPMSLDHIDRLISDAEAMGDARGRKVKTAKRRRFVRRMRTLYLVRHHVRLLGGIPNLYADTRKADWRTDGNGRLWGTGDFNLQRCPKDVRKLLLTGTGWYDVDFKACHPSVFVALSQAYGVSVPTWEDYLANRKVRIAEIAEDIGTLDTKIKRIVLSLLYGQPLSKSPVGPLVADLGKTAVEKLQANPFITALRHELRVARRVIIDRHRQGFQIINAVGKKRDTRKSLPKVQKERNKKEGRRNPKRKPVHPRKLLSHILTGYESWALRTVLANQEGVRILIHDGFISEAADFLTDVECNLESAANQRFGFPLNLKLEASDPF